MRRSRLKKPRDQEEPRHGLRDMFVDRPAGDAGKVMLGVWGASEAEFGEIVLSEVSDLQAQLPDRFIWKIGQRPSRRPR
jgi:hypothetical protein